MAVENTSPTPPTPVDAAAILAKAVGDAMGPLRDELKELRASFGSLSQSKATSHMAGVPTQKADAGTVDAVDVEERDLPKGFRLARWMAAGMKSAMEGRAVTTDTITATLEKRGYRREAVIARNFDVRAKALNMSGFSSGGALVPVEFSTDLIELLRNATAVRQLGARVLPMGAALTIPAQASAATAYYVGETQAVTPSQPGFSGIGLSAKKLMALVPISNEMMEFPSVSLDALIRDDLVNAIKLKEDLQAIFGTGSQNAPRGLLSMMATANNYAATASLPKAPTLAEFRAEVAKAEYTLEAANIPMTRMGWIMSPRTKRVIKSIVDGYGNAIFAVEMQTQGTLAGYPFISTNQIPNNLDNGGSGTDWSRLILGDWSQFIIGESSALEMEFFPNATFDNSGTIVSGISNDLSVFRAKLKHDFAMRYNNSHVAINVEYGAP
jgi:HK97 family phage major capsid protein